MVSLDFISVIIYFVGFLYWPLLYIRLCDVFSGYELTRNKLLISLVFAAAASLPASMLFPIAVSIFLPLALAVALASVIVLGLMSRISTRRTKVKVVILAAYLHLAWQMLPQISVALILLDLLGDAVVLLLAKFDFKKVIKKKKQEKQQQQQESLSLSELWK